MRKTYKEKLLDPRWQKRRLEVLAAHRWECDACGARDKTLHVHHREYWPFVDPWDYPNGWLEVLCEECHRAATSESFEDKAERERTGEHVEFHRRVFGLLPMSPGSCVEDILAEVNQLDYEFHPEELPVFLRSIRTLGLVPEIQKLIAARKQAKKGRPA